MFDSVFFFASKIIWPLLSPSTWLVVIPVIAFLLARLSWRKIARALWLLEFLLVLSIGFLPVGQWLAMPLELYQAEQPEPDSVPDGIIVLGGSLQTRLSAYWQQPELNHAAERDIAMVALARRYPEASLVFTGGSGSLLAGELKEANVARQLYASLGVDIERVIFESDSRNTYENARFSKILAQPNADQNWWLITSAYHMPRAVGIFCKQGWRVTPYAVDHMYHGDQTYFAWALSKNLRELDIVSREWLGLLVYRITGKTASLFPNEDCN